VAKRRNLSALCVKALALAFALAFALALALAFALAFLSVIPSGNLLLFSAGNTPP
jgi:hypothetical protein